MSAEIEFRNKVLSRGYDYFRDGKVTDVVVNDGMITARVEGSEDYKVIVYLETDDFPDSVMEAENLYEAEIESMVCNCPYATQSRGCKHMAAVLFYLKENDLLDDYTLDNYLTLNDDIQEILAEDPFANTPDTPKDKWALRRYDQLVVENAAIRDYFNSLSKDELVDYFYTITTDIAQVRERIVIEKKIVPDYKLINDLKEQIDAEIDTYLQMPAYEREQKFIDTLDQLNSIMDKKLELLFILEEYKILYEINMYYLSRLVLLDGNNFRLLNEICWVLSNFNLLEDHYRAPIHRKDIIKDLEKIIDNKEIDHNIIDLILEYMNEK